MLIIAKTLFGLEEILAKEIKQIGGKKIVLKNRAVTFEGNLTLLYLANIKIRTATQIILPIKKFKIYNSNDLYKKSLHIKWDNIFDVEKTFSIKSTVNSKFFNHTNYPSLLLKDSIVDYFKKRKKTRPNVDAKNADIKINLHIDNNLCTISLDSSGDLLYKRGYRKEVSIAPINEVLASGIILLTDWKYDIPLYDPMCGSGTLLIEALMIAKNIPPNIERKKFGFSAWKNFDKKILKKLKNDLKSEIIHKNFMINGSDNNQKNIRICRENINSIFHNRYIKIKNLDFFDTNTKSKTLVVFNPPYGQRINIEKEIFYEKIGRHLKHNYVGSEIWIFGQNEIDNKLNIGLKATKKIKLMNGGLECSLNKYEIFSGKNKDRFSS